MGEKTIVKSETLSEEKLAEARRKIMHWQKKDYSLMAIMYFLSQSYSEVSGVCDENKNFVITLK